MYFLSLYIINLIETLIKNMKDKSEIGNAINKDETTKPIGKTRAILSIIFNCLGILAFLLVFAMIFIAKFNWAYLLAYLAFYPIIAIPCHIIGITLNFAINFRNKSNFYLKVVANIISYLSTLLTILDIIVLISFSIILYI